MFVLSSFRGTGAGHAPCAWHALQPPAIILCVREGVGSLGGPLRPLFRLRPSWDFSIPQPIDEPGLAAGRGRAVYCIDCIVLIFAN